MRYACLVLLAVAGCAEREPRVDAAHILEPVDPLAVGAYPENGYFPVARAPAASPLLGGPTIYDEVQDMHYHGVWITPQEWHAFVLARSARGVPTVTRPVDPAMPRVSVITAKLQQEVAAIRQLAAEHPDLALDEIAVRADALDDQPPPVVVQPHPGPIQAIMDELDRSAAAMETLLAEETPARMAHRLIRERRMLQRDLADHYLAVGRLHLDDLVGEAWPALRSANPEDAETAAGRDLDDSWAGLNASWREIEFAVAQTEALPYEELALLLRRAGTAIRAVEGSPAYQRFLAGDLHPQPPQDGDRKQLRQDSVALLARLARVLVSVAQIYRPEVLRHDQRLPVIVHGYGS
ncbi:MAG: hypothetical protein ACOCXA_00540 [Planctomycetota bacterium]